MMDHCLTIALAVLLTASSAQSTCQISVKVTRSNSSPVNYYNEISVHVQAGDSVSIGCTGGIKQHLFQDGEETDLPLDFNVNGESLAVKNTTYRCDCSTPDDTAETVIQTVTIPNFRAIDEAKVWNYTVGQCVVIPCQLDSDSTGLTVAKEWWYARMSPSNKVTDVGRVMPRRGCDAVSCTGGSPCVKAGNLVIPNVTEANEEYVYWCTVRYTQTTHSKLQTIDVSS